MLHITKNIARLASFRTNDLSESDEIYYHVINELYLTNEPANVTRAAFIKEQLEGDEACGLFDLNRESWGIPKFDEELVASTDFKKGFLFCFRDHTTSWTDSQQAKTWFLTSPEALFIRRYEFWTCDNGFDECIDMREGSYKEILLSLLKDGDFDVLESPVFSNSELEEYINTYDLQGGDYTIEEIIEDHISLNPNYKSQGASPFQAKRRKPVKIKEADYPPVRNVPLYIILACGIIVILAGIYLLLVHGTAQSFRQMGRYGGVAHQLYSIDPLSTIIIGVGICVYPIYQLIWQKQKYKN